MLSADKNGADQLLFSLSGSILMFSDGKSKAQLVHEPNLGDGWEAVSAIAKSRDERVVLEQNPDGGERVVTWSKSGARVTSQLPTVKEVEHSPANPDALGIGADGVLAIIRTPSGSFPASEREPALAISLSGTSSVLAPWSTLAPAGSAECTADQEGYRAIVQTRLPWIKMSQWDNEETLPMLMRVNWSAKRVCLEAVEIGARMTSMSSRFETETIFVARFGSSPTAGQVGLVPGIEYRQPMKCTLKTK